MRSRGDTRFRFNFGAVVWFRDEVYFVVQRRIEAGGRMGLPAEVSYKIVPAQEPNADGRWAFEEQLRGCGVS